MLIDNIVTNRLLFNVCNVEARARGVCSTAHAQHGFPPRRGRRDCFRAY